MPHPKKVYDNPGEFWDFLTSPDDGLFESQHFERKQAGRRDANGLMVATDRQIDALVDGIKETVSAFANANREGGLIVVGLSKVGEEDGIAHLTDSQRRKLMAPFDNLVGQAALTHEYEYVSRIGQPTSVYLMYVPSSERAICETNALSPKAWYRRGSQNSVLTHDLREQILRDKGVVQFELLPCCPYRPADLDQEILSAFRAKLPPGTRPDISAEDLLYTIGALVPDGDGLAFTNAGLLFFAAYPQRVFAATYIRVVRYDCTTTQRESRRLDTFDRSFKGPLIKQIHEVRDFFRTSSLIKIYNGRRPDGTLFQEPQYPAGALDEAIVNAVVHRDYAIHLPIECEYYQDALVVANPGRFLQREFDVPKSFSLATVSLVTTRRNPHLLEWMLQMRDNDGAPYVRAMREGTRSMKEAMEGVGLPAPDYLTSDSTTTLFLRDDKERRKLIQVRLQRQAGPAASALLQSSLFDDGVETPVDPDTVDYRLLEMAVKQLGPLPPGSKYHGSRWVVRVLWALGVARRAGLGPQKAAWLARIIRTFGGEYVERTNLAQFLREERPRLQFGGCWQEWPSGSFAITDTGESVLAMLMETQQKAAS